MMKSKVTEVAVRRKFNLGNYETIDIELTASIDEEEDYKEIAKKLERETRKFRESLEE